MRARCGEIEPVERDPGWFSETGGRDQGGEQFARLAGQTGDRGNILVIERGPQRGPALAGNSESLRNRRHQGGQGDVHRQMRHADVGQGLAGHRDRLDVGRRTGGANQFRAHLPDLALGPHLRRPDTQYLPGVAQAQRPRPMRQPGRGDTRDLRRHIGAQRDHAVRDRVHCAERVARHRAAGPRQQRLLELDERRLDALVAVRCEHADQPPGDRGLDLGLGRQQVVQSGRQQRRVRCVIHCRRTACGVTGSLRHCVPFHTAAGERVAESFLQPGAL